MNALLFAHLVMFLVPVLQVKMDVDYHKHVNCKTETFMASCARFIAPMFPPVRMMKHFVQGQEMRMGALTLTNAYQKELKQKGMTKEGFVQVGVLQNVLRMRFYVHHKRTLVMAVLQKRLAG